MNTKEPFLFNEFKNVSAKEWKQKIQVDLKGADYNQSLIWNSPEAISVKPFYHQDFFKEGDASTPFYPKKWLVTQHIFIDDVTKASRLAKDALNRGAEAIYFNSNKIFDIPTLFSGLDLTKKVIFVNFTFFNTTFTEELIRYFSEKKIQAYLFIDPIHQLAKTGNWFANYSEDFSKLTDLFKKFPSHQTLSVNLSTYQNAGATGTQQLAFALAHTNEYFNYLHNFLPESKPKVTFQVAVGGNYFFEIAKIRALRKLFKILADEYNFPDECYIISMPSKRNKTIYDYNVNMLRTTTETMSAVLGGSNAVYNLPYDVLYKKSNEFGERIARNQLLILKEESYFNFNKNPTEGAYYIETLLHSFSENALKIFKEIEKGDGFIKQLLLGKIQQKIEENAQKEQTLFDNENLVLVGTNKYPNNQDIMTNNLELYPFLKIKKRKTLIKPILEKRLAEKLEQKRLKNETV